MSDQDVAETIRRILAIHNPIPPWLSEAHWDDDYYAWEATRIAAAFPGARSVDDVHQILVEVFDQTLPGILEHARQTDDRLDERLEIVARDIWARKPITST